jgi:nitrite reductase (NADH) small subunit
MLGGEAHVNRAEHAGAAVDWYRVARVDQIPRLGARTVTVGGSNVALFRTSTDDIFALEDRCPHRGGPLSQGIVHGHCVTCPLHDWVIDLATGQATGPDDGATRTFHVRIDNGDVWLSVAVLR